MARTLFFGCLFLFLFSPATVVRAIDIDADRQLAFADHLFAAEDYDRAVTEYQRFIFLFPEDGRIEKALYQIGMSHFNTGGYADAAKAFLQVIDRTGGRPIVASDDIAAQAYFRVSDCYVRMGAAGQAVNNLNNLAAVAGSPRLQDEARYRMGWILLEEGLWKNSAAVFGSIRPEGQDRYRLPELFRAMESYGEVPRKSPVAAGALAVVPGAGYLYCGRYRDALVSFILNGAMIVAAYTAFDDGNPALGGLLTLVEFGFYSGNIYGSIAGAHKYNRDQTERFISGIRNRYKIDLSLAPDFGGAALAFRYTF